MTARGPRAGGSHRLGWAWHCWPSTHGHSTAVLQCDSAHSACSAAVLRLLTALIMLQCCTDTQCSQRPQWCMAQCSQCGHTRSSTGEPQQPQMTLTVFCFHSFPQAAQTLLLLCPPPPLLCEWHSHCIVHCLLHLS